MRGEAAVNSLPRVGSLQAGPAHTKCRTFGVRDFVQAGDQEAGAQPGTADERVLVLRDLTAPPLAAVGGTGLGSYSPIQ